MSATSPISSQVTSPHTMGDEDTLSHVPGRHEKVASEIAQMQLNQPGSSDRSDQKRRKARIYSELSDADKEADRPVKRTQPNSESGVPEVVLMKLKELEAQRHRLQQAGPILTKLQMSEMGHVLNEMDNLKSQYYMTTKQERETQLTLTELFLKHCLLDESNDSELLSLLSDVLRKQALLLYGSKRKKKFIEALEMNERSLTIDPKNAFAINISGKINAIRFTVFSTGAEKKVSGDFAEKRLRETLDHDVESIGLLGSVLIEKSKGLKDKEEVRSKILEAESLFTKALEKAPENMRLATTAADFLFMELLPVLEEEQTSCLEKGKEAIREFSEELLRKKLAEFPENECIIEDLLQVLYVQIYNNLFPEKTFEKLKEMENLIDKYQRLNSNPPEVLIWRARLLVQWSSYKKEDEALKLEQAEHSLSQAVSLMPECQNLKREQLACLTRLVVVLKGKEQVSWLKRLESLLRDRILEDPNDINLRLELGRAIMFQGKNAEAEKEFIRIIKMKSDCAQAWRELGILSCDRASRKVGEEARNLLIDAKEKLKKSLELEPRNTKAEEYYRYVLNRIQ
ncbi:MAG: hypothetical protein WAM28_01815 [Chlamydiales bacterium]